MVTNTPNFLPGEAGHNCYARNVRGSSTYSKFGSRNINKSGLCNFGELPIADPIAKKYFGDWSQDDEESVKNLFLDLVLHAR